MPTIVTIEGSPTPCVFLPMGQQRTVTKSEFIDTLVAKGYVTILSTTTTPDPDPVDRGVLPEIPAPRKTPKGTRATVAEWRAHLDHYKVPYDPEGTKADLIAAWEAREEG